MMMENRQISVYKAHLSFQLRWLPVFTILNNHTIQNVNYLS